MSLRDEAITGWNSLTAVWQTWISNSYQLFLRHRHKMNPFKFYSMKKICLEAGWRFQSCESSHRSLRFVFLMWLHHKGYPPTPRDPEGPVCLQKSRFSFCWILVTKIFFLSGLVCFYSLEQPGSRFRSAPRGHHVLRWIRVWSHPSHKTPLGYS